MNVLHANTHMNAGGIGQYILTLTAALKDSGVQCLVASSGGDLEEELKRCGIPHRHLDIRTKFFLSPKVLKAVSALVRIVKDEKIDLIHAHTRVSQVASHFTSRRTGIPYISTCHGYFKARMSRKIFDTWGVKVIAISGAVRQHLEKDFRVAPERIELVYNGVDIGRFSSKYGPEELARVKKGLGLGDGAVIGTLGRFSPVKGQRYLVEAMRYVIAQNKDAQCLVMGSGAEENSLRELATSLGIESHIKFTRPVYRDVPLYMSCMDVFVLPSVREGLGMAILEAMSEEKPCVGSDIGGIRDIIEDEANGLLVPVQDAEAIAKAALRLLNDKAL